MSESLPSSRPAAPAPRLISIVWPFIAVALFQALTWSASFEILSSVRAYVSGESLWSKGQKDAIHYLNQYIDTLDPVDYVQYEKAIAIPLGDRQARLALESPEQDDERARQGFLQGGNHPDDIAGIIFLFRYFREVSYFRDAIGHWRQGDIHILRLIEVAKEVKSHPIDRMPSHARKVQWQRQISQINEDVTPAARAFSNTLGEGSRFIAQVLLITNLFSSALLVFLAVRRTRKLLLQRRQFESALRTEKERAQVTLASISDAVLTTAPTGTVEYLNPAAERLTGCQSRNAQGQPLTALFRILSERGDAQEGAHLLAQALDGMEHNQRHPGVLQRNDGSAVPISLAGQRIETQGEPGGSVLVLHDMTRERQFIADLSWQATHDALTGLANRRELERRLELALERLSHGGQPCIQHGLMFLDLDQFKIVNDTCGHAAGDELLRQICALLKQRLRGEDTLARLGGDEFCVLLEHCPQDTAEEIAEHLRQAVQDLRFSWQGRAFSVSVSIGLVHLQPGPRTSLADALRAADIACYMAKEHGRNRVQVYWPDDLALSHRQDQMEWVQRIHQALAENRLCLFAQPIIPLNPLYAGERHVELLLRMRDEHDRLVPPFSFIPAAERYGLMPQIDRWVIKHALSTLAQRRHSPQFDPKLVCTINLSGASIGDNGFLSFLFEQFEHYQIEPHAVCFEITETSAIAHLPQAASFIAALRAFGCRFSLDDFGAGMSSFNYLKHLPVDYVKIDGGFVKDMSGEPIDQAIVSAINQIGHVMGKRTIAEFVETQDIRVVLQGLGVDYAQGNAMGLPLPFSVHSELHWADALLEPDSGG